MTLQSWSWLHMSCKFSTVQIACFTNLLGALMPFDPDDFPAAVPSLRIAADVGIVIASWSILPRLRCPSDACVSKV